MFRPSLADKFLLPALSVPYEMKKAEHALLEIPAFQAMKQYDPATYQSVMTDLHKSLKQGKGERDLLVQIKARVVQLVKKRLPVASDRAVVSYMRVMVREIRELTAQDPELCYKFLYPQKYGAIGVQKYLPKEVVDSDFVALAEVIKTSAEDPQPVPYESDVSDDLRLAVAALKQKHAESVAALQHPHDPSVNKSVVCGAAADLYDNILALPQEKSGKVLRYMLSGN